MKHISTPTLLALAVIQATPSFAQQNKLEEVVVTSSRVEMPLREVGTSMSVVTEQDLQLRGFTSLGQSLSYEPSISVTNAGSIGSTSSLKIRGENGFRTKVYIDGIDISDASSPQVGPRMEHIMSAGVDRVEILRGPQGMMYGADAGGIVNITTFKPEGDGIEGGVNAEYGSFNSSQIGGHLGGGSDKGDIVIMGSRLHTDGYNSRIDDTELADNDGYTNSTVHGRAGWNFTEGWRAEVVLRQVSGTNEYDSCSGEDDCEAKFEQGMGRVSLSQTSDTLTNTIAYNTSGTHREFFTLGESTYETEGDIGKFEYIGSWQALDSSKVIYGADRSVEKLDDGTTKTDRKLDGYYAEYQGSFFDSLYLTAGARRDHSDDFGRYNSWRVSGAYLIGLGNGEMKLKGTYGTGFRAPSLSEISYNDSPNAFSPASETTLGAEESKGYDLGIAYYSNAGWFTELVYFDQRVDKEIYFDLINYSGYLQGAGESKSRGVELIAEVPFARIWTIKGNYTYNTTKDTDGEPRLRSPKHLANLGLIVRPWNGRFTTSLHMRMARDVEDFGGELDDYQVFDLSMEYMIIDGLQVYGRVENLFNANYQVNPSYNTAGQAGYAGIRYSF